MSILFYYLIFIVLIVQIVPTLQTNRHSSELLHTKEENNGSKFKKFEQFDSSVLNTQIKREHGDLYINITQTLENNTNSPTTIQSTTIYSPITVDNDFLIVAERDKISRIFLPSGKKEVLPVAGLAYGGQIEFDLKLNCVYWYDYRTNEIGKKYISQF